MAFPIQSYGTIRMNPRGSNSIPNENPLRSPWSWRRWAPMTLAATVVLVLVLGVRNNQSRLRLGGITLASSAGIIFASSDNGMKTLPTSLPMPDGVNVGSWLSLEDYFFAGGSASEVATPDGATAAVCLPPLHTGSSTGPAWRAETDLLKNLAKETTLGRALRVFHAHRNSFLDFDEDLVVLKQLGIRSIRVPISWCLTDEDPATIDPKNTSDIDGLEKNFTCRDPFFDGILWPAVPRSLVEDLLRACGRHGIGVTLDMHTYPGGTSPGTFSGVWPHWPRFWTHGDQPATDERAKPDIGRTLWKDFVAWMESLDEGALKGLQALSPMNEPAHLAGVFSKGRGKDAPYLPPLPDNQATAYLAKLAAAATPKPRRGRMDAASAYNFTQVPDGPHLRVFKWLDDAIDTFRQSTLPSKGVQLAVNVHESVLNETTGYNNGHYAGDLNAALTQVIAAWWRGATSFEERSHWAVLDMHHYHAWSPACQGASDGHVVANYTCAIVEERTKALQRCTAWAGTFRKVVDQECGPGAQLMSGEMSASTHHKVRHACNDISTLRHTYIAQVEAARDANVKIYWWSYKMPYGGAFRPAWSFRHFLWLMGALPRPDESNFPCGDHVPIAGEPNDDIFVKK